MLKPDGLLLMTTPYNIGGQTREHFPELHQYTVASLAGRRDVDQSKTRRVDRNFRKSHLPPGANRMPGGHGSSLEMRVFTEASLRAVLCNAGFPEVHFASDNIAEFGIEHAETWSLPIAARKGTFHPPAAELALQYREAQRLAARKIRDLEAITAEYERHVAHHNSALEEWVREAALRAEWVKRVEASWEERTAWALEIQSARDQAIAEFRRVAKSEAEAWQAVETLSKNLEQANANLARLSESKWTRLGRKLRIL